jgi:hypothetical protein
MSCCIASYSPIIVRKRTDQIGQPDQVDQGIASDVVGREQAARRVLL